MIISLEWFLLSRRPVAVGGVEKTSALFRLQLLRRHVLSHSREVGIDQTVRITLPALACIAAVLEASALEHLPDSRVAPVVRALLWPDAEVEVVVAAL